MQMMGQQQLNINIAALRASSSHSIYRLSKRNRDRYRGSRKKPAYVDMARQQQRIEQVFNSLADSLYELSTELPQFANRINEQKAQTRSVFNPLTDDQATKAISLASRKNFGGLNFLS